MEIDDTLAQVLQLRSLDFFLRICSVKRQNLIPNIILKLHQEYYEKASSLICWQVSNTHMPSHMGPSYFVAGVRGVPSEVKYLGTALSLLQASDFLF